MHDGEITGDGVRTPQCRRLIICGESTNGVDPLSEQICIKRAWEVTRELEQDLVVLHPHVGQIDTNEYCMRSGLESTNNDNESSLGY